MQNLTASFQKNKQYFRADVLAGITVALALIPEAIAFAFVAGGKPATELANGGGGRISSGFNNREAWYD